MPFTVRDFESLVRALEKRPEWRVELRRLLLTEELLSLPDLVRQLTIQVQRLAEVQQRTEARLEQLAEAQQRTEARLEQLAQAQQRTEARLEQLAEAQRRTEEQIARLVDTQKETARQVGALADTIGFALEDLAREVGPAYLEKHHGIHVPALERRFLALDGQEVEVDLYGEGTRGGERVVVVGEVKGRIYGRDVEALGRRVQALAPRLPGTPVPVLFGFVIHPSARDAAGRIGAVVISSTGKL